MRGSRRQFLSAGLVGLQPKSEPRIGGAILDDSHLIGHKLRDGTASAAPREQVRVPVVLIGGGAAGLSAAWRLDKRGFRDFVLLEMEKQPGGNSRWGENEVSAYPWAAHYLPVPNRGATLVRELCEELGLLSGGEWEERHLCHSPQERAFIHGRWQAEIHPENFGGPDDRRQVREFERRMESYAATGAFTIPIEQGKVDAALDRIPMAEWLRAQGFTSPYLEWYVDYACRDDFGSLARDTSAWAGIHYFAAREHEERGPFTWPEGNGWIIRKLLAKLERYCRKGAMVVRLERRSRGWRVLTEKAEYDADAVIWAAPTFLLRYVMADPPPTVGMVYSPWLTANLTLHRLPRETKSEPAWDNVIYGSPSLGYVVATHQSLRSRVDRSVWTWYLALAKGSPADNRRLLLDKDWSHWKELILNDLARAHPDIRQCVSRIDVMRFGHAMGRPVPGWMSSPVRRGLAAWGTDLVLANSDLSGMSIFEEAQYRGVAAADRVLRRLGGSRPI